MKVSVELVGLVKAEPSNSEFLPPAPLIDAIWDLLVGDAPAPSQGLGICQYTDWHCYR